MSVENFMYFILGSVTFLTVMITSSVHKEEVIEIDSSTQTNEEPDPEFPGIEFVPEQKVKKKECNIM